MNLKEVKHDFGWFKVFNCGHGIYAINETYKNTMATSYLICGDNQSILFDTGCGIGRMKKLVFSLTSVTPIVFNSHPTAFHSGANKKFDLVNILNESHAIDGLTYGFNDQWIDAQEKLCEEDTSFAPVTFTTVSNAQKFSLGEKLVEVISNEETKINGCMLADQTNKILFTGDIFDEEAISNLNEDEKTSYEKGLQEFVHTFKDYTWFFSTGEMTSDSKKQALVEKYA